jgi:hypothetical protein
MMEGMMTSRLFGMINEWMNISTAWYDVQKQSLCDSDLYEWSKYWNQKHHFINNFFTIYLVCVTSEVCIIERQIFPSKCISSLRYTSHLYTVQWRLMICFISHKGYLCTSGSSYFPTKHLRSFLIKSSQLVEHYSHMKPHM